jgi:hypothetical protein
MSLLHEMPASAIPFAVAHDVSHIWVHLSAPTTLNVSIAVPMHRSRSFEHIESNADGEPQNCIVIF